ncbi:Mitochondrial ssDNA-binding protein [Cladobotryum mycophilum]|uniref:Mitochondrial ssDNA-binding protein n=1 Tax=Cladobotryum mycophilum TaxID=491253 RepID=A0ABR0SD56_9HYPO
MSASLFRRATVASAGAARAFSTSSPRPFARINIIGNLADTPEPHATSSGREILKFSVASNTGPKANRKTSWFNITSFAEGNSKDFLLSVPKGSLVYIEGDATINSYQDANGNSRQGLNIVQRNMEVLKRPSPPEQGE